MFAGKKISLVQCISKSIKGANRNIQPTDYLRCILSPLLGLGFLILHSDSDVCFYVKWLNTDSNFFVSCLPHSSLWMVFAESEMVWPS